MFDLALRTIDTALKTGQIGTPVAVRIVAHSTADHGQIEPLAARGLEAASRWLGSLHKQIATRGSVKNGHISVLANFKDGQSALVNAGSSGVGSPLLEFVVVGNRGILSWENGKDGFVSASDERPHDELSAESRRLLEQIRKSLNVGAETDTPTQKESGATSRKGQRPPYGVLLVAGDHTHQPGYSEALAADKRCRLVGLTDEADVSSRRKALNEALAKRLDIPVFPDLSKALSRNDVQIVSICAEPIRRGRIIVEAAKAGKHLYLDKPFAGSLADADAIVAATGKADVVSHMFSLVHTDTSMRARDLVESGELGDLVAVHFDLCFAKGTAGTAKLGEPRKESAAPDRFELADSKRELANIGVYPLAMLLSLTGRKPRSVTATTGNYFFAEHQANDMEDFGQMLVELDGGFVSTISVGRTGWRSNPGGGLNRTYLIGTKKTAVVDTNRPRVEVWADVDAWKSPKRDPDDPMGMWAALPDSPYRARPKQSWITPPSTTRVSDAEYFLNCVEQGRDSMVSAELAAETTEILMGAYQSAASGKLVELPLPH